MLKIGCHVSSSKGYAAMGKTALSVGANTFQYFSRNPRGGSMKAFDPADADRLTALCNENEFAPIVVHAPYTVNPCSADPRALEFARTVLKEDIERCEYFDNMLYNLHPGCHVGQGTEEGVRLIAESLNMAMKEGMRTTVLLETMAGKGTEVGGRFEELRAIMDRITVSDRIGVCMDTCHVFDGGYDIVDQLDDVLTSFDKIIGLKHLYALHINDSKNPIGSHKDRHECIGKGHIGTEAIVRILKHPALCSLPCVLETPNELDGYKAEITLLRSLTD